MNLQAHRVSLHFLYCSVAQAFFSSRPRWRRVESLEEAWRMANQLGLSLETMVCCTKDVDISGSPPEIL